MPTNEPMSEFHLEIEKEKAETIKELEATLPSLVTPEAFVAFRALLSAVRQIDNIDVQTRVSILKVMALMAENVARATNRFQVENPQKHLGLERILKRIKFNLASLGIE